MMQSQTLERATTSPDLLRLHPGDDVAVALRAIDAGEELDLEGDALLVREAIPHGHKVALRDLAEGETIRKFGWPIGQMTAAARRGEHVHAHNLRTLLSGVEGYRYAPVQGEALPRPQGTFRGYRRPDGRVGTRNEIWILPTVGCVGRTAERLASISQARHAGAIDGIYAFTHPFGCSQLGDDLAGTRAILAALACHPNAGGVLLVGLGCESNQMTELLAEIPEALRGRIRTLGTQSVGDEIEEGLGIIDGLVATAALAQRQDVPLSELTIGLKCGGSDGFSGLTANPLVGRVADRVVGAGGAAVLTEIPEIFGG